MTRNDKPRLATTHLIRLRNIWNKYSSYPQSLEVIRAAEVGDLGRLFQLEKMGVSLSDVDALIIAAMNGNTKCYYKIRRSMRDREYQFLLRYYDSMVIEFPNGFQDEKEIRIYAAKGDLVGVKEMVHNFAFTVDVIGDTLVKAAEYGRLEVVKYLTTIHDFDHETLDAAIYYSGGNGHKEVYKYLNEFKEVTSINRGVASLSL